MKILLFGLLLSATSAQMTTYDSSSYGDSRCDGEFYRCPESIIEAGYGLSKEFISKDFPKKLTCGVNCILKIHAPPKSQILVKWHGFVLDGCHQGNAVRITDGPQQETYCGDKLPPVYKSVTNMVEIAMTAVNLGNKNKGILYKFVYEVIPPRRMRQNPALIRPSMMSVSASMSDSMQSTMPMLNQAVRPAGANKTPRKTYQLTAKERELKAKWDAEKEAKELIKEEQNQAEEDLAKLQGPILYMIVGIVCMLIAISAVIKIILCGKGRTKQPQAPTTTESMAAKLADDNKTHTFKK